MTDKRRLNHEGDTLAFFRWRVCKEIHKQANSLGIYRGDGAKWSEAAFNTNYDPKAAAYEWLTNRLKQPHE